jgi:hypothetical protein
VEGGDTPVQPPGAISPTTPEAPDKPVNPEEPVEPEEPAAPAGPPKVTDAQVYLFGNDGSLPLYTGSGSVVIEDGIGGGGQISNGKLSFTVPETIPPSNLAAISDGFKPEPGVVVEIDTIAISDPVAKGAMIWGFDFTEQTGDFPNAPYQVFPVKDITKNGSSFIVYLYVDKPLTIKGRLKTKEVTTGADWTRTWISDDEWDVALQAGWNRIQLTHWYDNKPNDYSQTNSYNYKNAPADTSAFKWVLNPDFEIEEFPYIFDAPSHTVALNIMSQGDGTNAYLPADPECDRWEHASATEFPAGGKWNNTDNDASSTQWIEFDTAAKTLKYHWENNGGSSPFERRGIYHNVEAGDTLRVAWLYND